MNQNQYAQELWGVTSSVLRVMPVLLNSNRYRLENKMSINRGLRGWAFERNLSGNDQ